MYYTSDLINEILTSDKAKEILDWIPPVYEDAYVFLWLLQANSMSIQRMENLAEDIKLQTVPQTATWSIGLWEERYDILSDESLTLQQRRNQVVNRRRTRAPMPPKKVEDIISNITGFPTRIEENTGKNHFTVICEGMLTPQLKKLVKKEVDRIKPSHLIYTIKSALYYDADTTKYAAGAPAVKITYNVEEVV